MLIEVILLAWAIGFILFVNVFASYILSLAYYFRKGMLLYLCSLKLYGFYRARPYSIEEYFIMGVL